jgi:hypothetical protein
VSKHLPVRLHFARDFVFGSVLALMAPRVYQAYQLFGVLRIHLLLARSLDIIARPFNYLLGWLRDYLL